MRRDIGADGDERGRHTWITVNRYILTRKTIWQEFSIL